MGEDGGDCDDGDNDNDGDDDNDNDGDENCDDDDTDDDGYDDLLLQMISKTRTTSMMVFTVAAPAGAWSLHNLCTHSHAITCLHSIHLRWKVACTIKNCS